MTLSRTTIPSVRRDENERLGLGRRSGKAAGLHARGQENVAQIDRVAAVNEASVTNRKPLGQFTSKRGIAAARTARLAPYFSFSKCGPLKCSGCWGRKPISYKCDGLSRLNVTSHIILYLWCMGVIALTLTIILTLKDNCKIISSQTTNEFLASSWLTTVSLGHPWLQCSTYITLIQRKCKSVISSLNPLML